MVFVFGIVTVYFKLKIKLAMALKCLCSIGALRAKSLTTNKITTTTIREEKKTRRSRDSFFYLKKKYSARLVVLAFRKVVGL